VSIESSYAASWPYMLPFSRYYRLKLENSRFPSLTPMLGGNPLEFMDKLTPQKLEGRGYRMVKISSPMFNRFCMIHPCDGRTGNSIQRAKHICYMLSGAKNLSDLHIVRSQFDFNAPVINEHTT